MALLRMHLLGAPHIERGEQPLHFVRRRALALGVYLAVTGVAHSRDALTTLLWPEAGQSEGRANLRRILHALGRTVGEDFVVAEDDRVRLHHNGNLWLDLEQFRGLVAACHRHGHSVDVVCPDCLPLLTEAADLYRDDFLAGFSLPDSPNFDRWQFFQAEQARAEMALVLDLLTRSYISQGHYIQAMVYAQRRLAFDPLYEPAHRQLMQLYAWTEQPAAAQRQYALCTRLLAQELGVPPAEETEELYRAICDRRLALPARAAYTPAVPTAAEDDIRILTVVSAGLVTDEEAADVATRGDQVQRLFRVVAQIAQRYGGHVERVVGDDILALFGRDRVHEDDAERGVRVALEVLQQMAQNALSVRIGVNTGMAYCRREGQADVTVMGGVVNLAARLRNRAPQGKVLVGRNTYLATRGLCDYAPITLHLPGATAGVLAYQVVRQHPHAAKTRGIEGLSAELVGRDPEMACLQAALAKTLAGEGQVVAISGEAGVGKSRLVAELKQMARAQAAAGELPAYPSLVHDSPFLWLEGRGVEHAMGSAYWLFGDMLRGHFAESDRDGNDPAILARHVAAVLNGLATAGHLTVEEVEEIGPLLGWLLSLHFGAAWDARLKGVDADRVRQRAFAAMRRYLVALAQRQPLVLVFEDLHWADALSLALVAALLDDLPGNALLLLCVYRPETGQAEGGLAALARRKRAARLTELALTELSPAHSRQMIASLLAIEQLPPAIREEILDKAQGNPLFLEEIVRYLVDAGVIYRAGNAWTGRFEAATVTTPESVQSLVLSRVDRLDAAQRLVLRAASVFGRLFRPAVLARLIPKDAGLDAGLADLRAQGFVYLERAQPEAEYSFRHVLVRDAIYQDLPRNWRVDLHRQAGQALEAHYAAELQPYVEELAHHYELGDDVVKAVEFLLRAGQKAQAAYLNEEALTYYRRSLAQAEALPGKDGSTWRLAALRGLGEVYATQGNLAEAEPPLRQAMALARQLELPAAEQARLYFPLCHLLRWLGRFEELFRFGQEGLALLEAGDRGELSPKEFPRQGAAASAEAVMLTTFLAAATYHMGRRRQYRSLTGPVIDALRRLGYGQQLIVAYGIAAFWYRDAKQVAEARSWIRSLKAEARRRNDLWTLGYLLVTPGYWLPEAAGDLDAILANFEEVLAIAETIGDEIMRGYVLTFWGLVQALTGKLAQAEVMLTEALAINERRGALHFRILDRKGIGFVRLCLGDWAGTVAVLERGLAEAAQIRLRIHGVQMSRLTLAYAYRMQGRHAEAAALYRMVAVEDEADGDGQSWIAFALAGLEQTLDDPDAFHVACREIAAARPAGDPLPLAQWRLQPAEPDTKFTTHGPAEPEMPDLTKGWSWCDLYGDCSYSAGDDSIVIYASRYYRDLWFNNVSAPRCMRAVSGDFALETLCDVALPDRPAMGGLVVWKDAENFLRLAWGAHGPHTLDLMGALGNRDLYLGRGYLPSVGQMYLRLERTGATVRGLCSADGREWFSVGQVAFQADDPLEAGLFATGMIQCWAYPSAYPDGTAVRFRSIRIWQVRTTMPL